MKTLAVKVPDEIASKIERAARERGVSVDDFLLSTVEEKLAREADFEEAAGRVLSKNAELYKRLS
jgi:hypothetical protein